MRKATGVVYELLPVSFAILKAVLFVHDNRVVGVAYLAAACTEHQLAIAGDGEDALGLVAVLFLTAFVYRLDSDGACEQVCLGTCAGIERESGDGDIEERREEGELGTLLTHVFFLGEQAVEVTRLALVGGLAGSAGGWCPHGFVDLDKLVAHVIVADDFCRLHVVDLLNCKRYFTHDGNGYVGL